jgi:DNA-binding PadR family transcriptional regulator
MRKVFRTGWLLLLIRCGPGYGYELRHELRGRDLELDRAVMYRSLREMEQMGWISSRWARSTAGPRRRVYDLTDAGRAELDRIAGEIQLARDAHEAFLQAYRTMPGGDAPGLTAVSDD